MIAYLDLGRIQNFVYAAVIGMGALVLHKVTGTFLEPKNFLILYPAVIISSNFFGKIPGFTTFVIIVIGYLSFVIHGTPEITDYFRILTFTAGSIVINTIIGSSKNSTKILKKTLRQLENIQRAIDRSSIVEITDGNGVIKYANDKSCEISKYQRSELIGKTHKILNSGHHNKDFFKNLWNTIKSGHVWQGEILNQAKDGASYWVDTVITPFLDEDGRPYEYITIRNDVTARNKIQEELQKAKNELEVEQARVKAVIEQMPAAVWVGEAPTGNLIFGNVLSRNMMKQPDIPAKIISDYGRYIGYRNGVQLRAEDWPMARTIMTGEKIKNEIIEIEKPDGTLGYCRFDASPVLNQNKAVIGAVVVGTDLTEYVRKEKEIAQSEGRLKRATETTGLGIWEMNINTFELARTPTHDEVYGYEYNPENNFDFFYSQFVPEDADKLRLQIKRIIDEGHQSSEEYRIIWPDKSLHWIELKGSLSQDDSGKMINLIGTVIDITERKRTESLLVGIVNHSPIPIIVCNFQGIVKIWNPSAEDLFGWSAPEVRGKFIPIIPDEEIHDFLTKMKKTKHDEKIKSFEATRRKKDGTEVDVIVSSSVLPEREDTVMLFSDLSKIRLAEESRKKTENLLQKLIDHSPYVIYLKNRRGEFLLVNTVFKSLFHNEPEQILGKTDFDLFDREVAENFSKNDEEVWRTSKPIVVEEKNLQDGKYVVYMSMKFPLLDEKGKPYAVAGISIDITERKKEDGR